MEDKKEVFIGEGSNVSKIPPTLKILPTSVTKCDAKIIASKRKIGVWCIQKVVLDHCYNLSKH